MALQSTPASPVHPFERYITAQYALNLWPATTDEILNGDSDLFVWLLHHADKICPSLEDSGWHRDEELFADSPARGLRLVHQAFRRLAMPSKLSALEAYCRRLQGWLNFPERGQPILALLMRTSLNPCVTELLHLEAGFQPNPPRPAVSIIARAVTLTPSEVIEAVEGIPIIARLLPFAERPHPDEHRNAYVASLRKSVAAIDLALLIGKANPDRGQRIQSALLLSRSDVKLV